MLIQFHREPPRQLKSRDKAVDGCVLHNAVFGVDDLQHQPPFRLFQHFNECLMAFLDFLLLCWELWRSIEAIVQVLE